MGDFTGIAGIIQCFISVVLGGGVFDRWWEGGSRSPVLAIFSGWSPLVGLLSKLSLWMDYSGSGFVFW